MSTTLQDLRFAIRTSLRSPVFTATVILTLGIGIGVNTAMFSVVNSILLQPLDYQTPESLVVVWNDNRQKGVEREPIAHLTFETFRREAQTLSGLAVATPSWNFTLTVGDGRERVTGQFVSAGLFPTLGVEPALGRWFGPDEDQSDAARVVVLGHQLWRDRFGADSTIVGRVITLDDQLATVVGVMPAGFRFLEDSQLWVPHVHNRFYGTRSVRLWSAVGRLAGGATVPHAQAELETIARRLEAEYPSSHAHLGATVVRLHDQVVGAVRTGLLALLGGVGFVLLIACANVASLFLSRSVSRTGEVAVRTAMGASRARLARQFVTESIAITLAGGAVGLLTAYWAVEGLRIVGPDSLPRLNELRIDRVVLAFTIGVTGLTGLAFGLLPVWLRGSSEPRRALGDRTGSVRSRKVGRARSALVVAQIALALVLLVGSGLLVRSFVTLLDVDPGFVSDRVLTLRMAVTGEQYATDDDRATFYRALMDSLEAIPGVDVAGATTRLPLGDGLTTTLDIAGNPLPQSEQPEVELRRATPGYFRAMSIPLVSGRMFTEADDANAPLVAVVNQRLAQQLLGANPVGAQIRFFGSDPDRPWLEVVGVVGDVRQFALDQDVQPEVYTPFAQNPPTHPQVAIRTAVAPIALTATVRNRIRQIDPGLVVWDVDALSQRVSASLAERRFQLMLASVFASMALLLAAIGIYGVVNEMVSQRMHEIGVRLALGADRRRVLGLIVGRGLILTAAGMTIGLVASYGVSRLLESLLFGVTPTDPAAFASVSVMLGLVAFLAAYLPSRRASRLDPARVLRYE